MGRRDARLAECPRALCHSLEVLSSKPPHPGPGGGGGAGMSTVGGVEGGRLQGGLGCTCGGKEAGSQWSVPQWGRTPCCLMMGLRMGL